MELGGCHMVMFRVVYHSQSADVISTSTKDIRGKRLATGSPLSVTRTASIRTRMFGISSQCGPSFDGLLSCAATIECLMHGLYDGKSIFSR